MTLLKFRSFVAPFITLIIILAVSIVLIAYGRGYRLDFTKNSLTSTGLIAATSDPIGAQVRVNGVLKTATNNSLNLEPGEYTVNISKEGYLSWQKTLKTRGEIVTRADAFLFPSNPSLSPITITGIERPLLSPDGTRIVYIIPTPKDGSTNKKAGLWLYGLAEGPLGRNRDPRLVAQSDALFDVTNAQIHWSPDSSSLLVTNGRDVRLYDLDRLDIVTNVTSTYQTILADWEKERIAKEKAKLVAFRQPIIDIASGSAKIISFSPDETKILYQATASASIPIVIDPPLLGTNPTAEERTIKPGFYYVYDSKEDKNYFVLDPGEITPTPTIKPSPTPRGQKAKTPPAISLPGGDTAPLHWFPTNRHLVLTIPGKIDIMEYDRTNWITVYSGPFVDGFIAPWPNGSRIIILTNFNDKAGSLPNLYTVNLR